MTTLFDRGHINEITLKNRFVRSATWEGMANEDGTTTSALNEYMAELARGGIGLIITGLAYMNKAGQSDPWQLGIDRDENIPGLKEMTDAVHREGAKIAVQISHAGIESTPELSGSTPQGPSAMKNSRDEQAEEMSINDIRHVCDDFGLAATRAKQAGFDAIQLHGAHGYLLSQFLSSYYNKRTDNYGGKLENKARLLLEILRTTREAVGNNFPVLCKLNSCDYIENGFTIEEMIAVSAMLEKAGIDAIEMSGGTRYSGKYTPIRQGLFRTEVEEAYYRQAALQYKMRCKTPLMLVGGIRSYSVTERLIEENVADYISLSRPLIREPGLIKRWQASNTGEAACISCNLCMKAAREEHHLYCVALSRQKK